LGAGSSLGRIPPHANANRIFLLRDDGDVPNYLMMPNDHYRATLWIVVASCWIFCASAQSQPRTPETKENFGPSKAQLEAVYSAAQRDGWAAQLTVLRSSARESFADDNLPAAAAWLGAYRWATLFSKPQSEFIPAWVNAVNDAKVGHNGMAKVYHGGPELLADSMTPECQAWVITQPEFSAEFFSLLQPVDFLPRVFAILSELHHHDPEKLETYSSLALAIALVYDVPPPPDWPHAQVTSAKLSRTWPDPVQMFDWLTQQDRLGRTQHSLRRLRADELKFVVDVSAPLKELDWAQSSLNLPLNQLERAYTMVPYRKDRMTKDKSVWPEADYALQTILAQGGICVDQAYFANVVGKARGVPTLFFRGVGDDGRHAWFGFLGLGQQWQLDAGRYAEQKFITGYARDPQTWSLISDHELKLLAQRSQASASFRHSRLMTDFAGDFLKDGDGTSALRAARKAVNYDRRNQRAWEILLASEETLQMPAKTREASLREAMLAFAHHPDLETIYSKRISRSLRDRGESSAADFEERRIMRKFALDRADLSLRQTREAMWRINGTNSADQLVRNYNATVDRMGPGAGIAFYDEIVVPVIQHLAGLQQIIEAERALGRARRTLRVEPESQLAQEFAFASDQLRALRK
jgi:hypothetical protein